jgi:ubiquinone/menaquinone biosynthesis C-methylase UbiE/DNA-binding transcriptional ArsR family regulator
MSLLSFDAMLERLRAIAEPTRVRLLTLLAKNELTVSDLVEITGQSQPRISRHLKLLQEAGLLTRVKEGSFVFYRAMPLSLLNDITHDDATLAADRERLLARRALLDEQARLWFQTNAAKWDELRALHVSNEQVEAAILALMPQKGGSLLDIGTGTGRMLELLKPRYDELIGIDNNPSMLSLARANLAKTTSQIRLGDLYRLDFAQNRFDGVILHQVLHYLDEPLKAIHEAARVLKPAGTLLIVDFAPHTLDILREEQAHRRLGFSYDAIKTMLNDAGLTLAKAQDLKPESADKLTVTLYIGTKT